MKSKTKNKTRSIFNVPPVGKTTGRFYRIWEKTVALLIIFTLMVMWSYFPVPGAKAAGLDSVTTSLTDSEAVSTESRVAVTFTPSEAVVNGDTILVYLGEDTSGTEWEDGDTDQSTADVACVQTDTTFDTAVYAAATASLPMYFGMSVNVVSGAGTAAITCTLGTDATDAPNNPATAGSHSVAVITTDDSGAGVAYVGNANDIDVSVTVLPNLSMTIDGADGTYCTTSSGVTACDLGTVLTTTLASGNYDLNAGTNATGGATISIAEDTDLGSIADCTEDDTIAAGTEDYGLTVSTTGTWSFLNTWDDNDTPIEASETFAETPGAIAASGDDITVTHKVAIDSTTVAGSHSHTVTWTIAADF